MKHPHADKFLADFEQQSDDMFRFAMYRVSDREVALDLVQDCFLETWKYISQGGGIESVRAFLFTVLRRRIIDWYRKHKSVSLDNLADSGFDPASASSADSDSVSADAAGIVKWALSQMDEYGADLIRMRCISELSITDIAKTLDAPPGTISVHLHRAKQVFKSIITQRGISAEFLQAYDE